MSTTLINQITSNKKLYLLLFFISILLLFACSAEKSILERGHRLMHKKDYARAIVSYSSVIKINPSSSDAYFYRGVAWMRTKNIDNALSDYSKAIELQPDDFQVYLYRADIYFNKKLFNKAIYDYTFFIRYNPDKPDAYRERGDAYYHNQNYQKAIEDYSKTITLDPNNSFAYNNLAWILSTCVDPNFLNGSMALNYIEHAIKLDRSIYNLSTYAAVYAENKRFDEAIEIMKEIVNSPGIDLELKGRFREYLILFQNHKPLRELPTF